MAFDFTAIPGWTSWENQGAGSAVADLDSDGQLDLVVLTVDAPQGRNAGYFRVGRGLAADGTVSGGWSDWVPVPDWNWWQNADAGIALADLDGDGRQELVVFAIDSAAGQNAAYYRVGWGLGADGVIDGGWGEWTVIPDWFPWANEGGDIAVADLDGDGRPELIVVMVDAPAGPNAGYYRVGWGLDASGTVMDDWSPWIAIPDWFPWANQGVGAAVADLDGDGRLELVVLQVDNPARQNGAYYTVGWGLGASGRAADGWGPWSAVPDWRFWENQGASLTVLDAGGARPDLLVLAVDGRPQRNDGFYRALAPELDIDMAAEMGVWRLLDFDTQISAVHAALLHTGDVLFFAGSSNNPANLAAHQFRTRVWHYPSADFSAPDTPIDLFCCGQAFLPDGRLLAAGGTEQYDPFRGLRDALVFDPATLRWTAVQDMAGGRWYPAMVTLSDGRVLAISGLGADGNLNVVPEAYSDGPGWSALRSPGPWPQYAHLFVLDDGRVFYSGGQYGSNNGTKPSIWNLATGATTVVPGLTMPDMRNQSASVLLGPAQEQRVMLIGGGGYDMHNMAPAIDDVEIADLSVATPVYAPAERLHMARMHLNAVLLPDRMVLVSGGAMMEEAAADAALDAEIYMPAHHGGMWMMAATARVPRLYHSVALLMPDGKVITAGSNPQRTVEELRIEVFWPPYLFGGPRPALALSADQADYGERLDATSADAARLREVSLVRPGATTHSADNEQRLVDVPFDVTGPGTLALQLPEEPNLAPPGWYMVFAVDADGRPSDAAWLLLGG